MAFGYAPWYRSPMEFCEQFAALLSSTDHSPATRQKDPVIQIIIQLLRNLKMKSISGFASRLRVQNTTQSPPLSFVSASTDNIKFYTFITKGEKGKDIVRTVPISVIPDIGLTKPNIDCLLVRTAGKWVPLESWIRELLRPYEQLTGSRGYQAQRRWWSMNGKAFPIMDLPPELRLCIFVHVIGPDIFPYCNSVPVEEHSRIVHFQNQVVFGRGYHHGQPPCGSPPEKHDMISPPNVNILMISRQVRKEALQAGWEGTRKCFAQASFFCDVANAIETVPFNILNRIQLSMKNPDYFEFFGYLIEEDGRVRPHDAKACDGFKKLPNLTTLELRFRDPWNGRQEDQWAQWAYLKQWTRDFSCSKVTTDWILTLAKQHVQHIHHIIITGYIKHSVREKWERIFADERRGAHYDESEDIQAILNAPAWNM